MLFFFLSCFINGSMCTHTKCVCFFKDQKREKNNNTMQNVSKYEIKQTGGKTHDKPLNFYWMNFEENCLWNEIFAYELSTNRLNVICVLSLLQYHWKMFKLIFRIIAFWLWAVCRVPCAHIIGIQKPNTLICINNVCVCVAWAWMNRSHEQVAKQHQ